MTADAHLEKPQDSKQLKDSQNADELDNFSGFEQAHQAGRAICKDHVPGQCRQDINSKKTLSILDRNLVFGRDQNICVF